MALVVLRCIFVLVAASLGATIVESGLIPEGNVWLSWAVFAGIPLFALAVIAIDVLVPNKQLDVISAIYFGMIVGLFLAYVVGLALAPVLDEPGSPSASPLRHAVQAVLAMVLCYTCISMLIQTRHDFRFIIPYVEFSKEVKGLKPYVLDTSVVIDGRIADVAEAKVMDTQLVMPRFVLAELQAIADSSDKMRRSRGRRGLDILNRMRANQEIDLQIFDRDLPELSGHPVDLKLVLLAKHLDGKIVTNDYNLNKVAKLHGVGVVNLNDLANALKPVFLPGESLTVRIVKPGEEPGQGVGYLDDGTMVVVEGGRDHQHELVRIAVTSVLQTSAGRMVFGRYEERQPG